MIRVGVHVSVAGGLHEGLLRAVEAGCDCAQIFLTNPRSWTAKPLEDEVVERFHRIKNNEAKSLLPLVAHMPYLPNLASMDEEIFRKSVESLSDNLMRCDALGINFLVVHMGKGEREEAFQRMREGIDRVYQQNQYKTCLLLENTAGQGRETGYLIPEICEFYESLPQHIARGLCFDTCHLFAAGYPMSGTDDVQSIADQISRCTDINNVKVVHLNDSVKHLGSRVDRHARIGEGMISREGFQALFQHSCFKKLPFILEVPRNDLKDIMEQIQLVKQLSLGAPMLSK